MGFFQALNCFSCAGKLYLPAPFLSRWLTFKTGLVPGEVTSLCASVRGGHQRPWAILLLCGCWKGNWLLRSLNSENLLHRSQKPQQKEGRNSGSSLQGHGQEVCRRHIWFLGRAFNSSNVFFLLNFSSSHIFPCLGDISFLSPMDEWSRMKIQSYILQRNCLKREFLILVIFLNAKHHSKILCMFSFCK